MSELKLRPPKKGNFSAGGEQAAGNRAQRGPQGLKPAAKRDLLSELKLRPPRKGNFSAGLNRLRENVHSMVLRG